VWVKQAGANVDTHDMKKALPLLLWVLGCGVQPSRPPAADSTARKLSVVDSSKPAPADRELVKPASLPSDIRGTCDVAATIMRQALGIDIKREDGKYFDSAHGVARLGCRLKAAGSFTQLRNESGPVGAVEAGFTQNGWRGDLRYMADGPDGSDIGLRRLDQLCMVSGRWDGGDDGDTMPRAPTEEDNQFEAIVECARDVPSNADAGVPDSIWRIAVEAGLDSVYAISLRLQYPPYLDGDFDGDGLADAAVLVDNRATGKSGVAIVHRGNRRVTILGAGADGSGPRDLSWIDRWDVFRRGTTYNLTIGDRPSLQMGADALWVGRQDSISAFYVWTGANYVWESHPLKSVARP
jgi:hypothetical protein